MLVVHDLPSRRAVLPMLLERRSIMIARMFDSIADRYDDLDHLLNAGLDEHWRTVMISQLRLTGHEAALDLCAGTGDVALRLRGAGARSVAAVDFAPAMLRNARGKSRSAGIDGIQFLCADAQHIPLRTASIAAAKMAFGLRNVEHPIAVITELRRVLRPGGRLVIWS